MEVLPRSRGSQMRQKTNAAAAYGYWENQSAYLNLAPNSTMRLAFRFCTSNTSVSSAPTDQNNIVGELFQWTYSSE